jgi:uncharacterized protein (DUF2141 family)
MQSFIKTITIAATLFAANASFSADLSIQIDKLQSTNGNLMIALYDNAANFPLKPVQARKLPVQQGEQQLQFKDLPTGDYAVAVYHDANSNGQIDKNEIGIPTEGYGFSNNAAGKKGPPSFDDAKISFNDTATQTKILINLR